MSDANNLGFKSPYVLLKIRYRKHEDRQSVSIEVPFRAETVAGEIQRNKFVKMSYRRTACR